MLRHFKTDFGIVHDIDWPRRRDGSGNGMWTINRIIREEIVHCRNDGRVVYHRWSVPDFERFLGGGELGKDKPYAAFVRTSKNEELKERVISLIDSVYRGEQYDPPGHNPDGDFIEQIEKELIDWAEQHGHGSTPRLNPSV